MGLNCCNGHMILNKFVISSLVSLQYNLMEESMDFHVILRPLLAKLHSVLFILLVLNHCFHSVFIVGQIFDLCSTSVTLFNINNIIRHTVYSLAPLLLFVLLSGTIAIVAILYVRQVDDVIPSILCRPMVFSVEFIE